MAEIDEKIIVEKLQHAHAALQQHFDKKITEERKAGETANAATLESIEKIQNEISHLRAALKESEIRAKVKAGLSQAREVSPDAYRAFDKLLRNGAPNASNVAAFTPDELRTLSGLSDGVGGILVPDDIANEILHFAYQTGTIRGATTVRTTGRDAVSLPSMGKVAIAWGNSNVAVAPQTPETGARRIEIHRASGLILASNDMLEDAGADVVADITMQFAMALGEAEDVKFCQGTGVNEPKGILGDAGILARFTKTGVAAALTDSTHNCIDALITALHSLKSYRPRASFVMNSLTEGLVRAVKDANGQYLWQPPVVAGSPATLLGRPCLITEGMPDVAANAFPIAVGDWATGFRVYDRRGVTVNILRERYADQQSTGVVLTSRVGASPVISEAFQLIKVAA